jgi:hypothetical protein
MDEHALLVVMSVFVFVAAVAMLVQAGYLFGIYKTLRSIHENTSRVLPKVEKLVTSSQAAVEDGRVRMAEITTKANAILNTSQKQLQTVEEFLTEAASRGRVQMDRAEIFLDDTMGRAQETVAMVQSTVITPLRQINGLAAGLRAALQFFLRGNRPSPDRATVDEEMFI